MKREGEGEERGVCYGMGWWSIGAERGGKTRPCVKTLIFLLRHWSHLLSIFLSASLRFFHVFPRLDKHFFLPHAMVLNLPLVPPPPPITVSLEPFMHSSCFSWSIHYSSALSPSGGDRDFTHHGLLLAVVVYLLVKTWPWCHCHQRTKRVPFNNR